MAALAERDGALHAAQIIDAERANGDAAIIQRLDDEESGFTVVADEVGNNDVAASGSGEVAERRKDFAPRRQARDRLRVRNKRPDHRVVAVDDADMAEAE